MKGRPPESVYFYTFHKCASSLFGSYILKNVEGLKHVDYATEIYSGEHDGDIVFDPSGFLYGPLRLSVDPASPVFHRLIAPASRADFVRDRQCLFLFRDPRDILVSAYYSFGFSHGFSPVAVIRAKEEQDRLRIQRLGIDRYAMDTCDFTLKYFQLALSLHAACPRASLLRYEDMIDDWPRFSAGLTRLLPLREDVLEEICRRSRPRTKDDPQAHHRSGKTGGYQSELKPETIEQLNSRLGPVLNALSYPT